MTDGKTTPPVVTTGVTGGNRFLKIALIGLGIVVIIILAEIGFLYLGKRGGAPIPLLQQKQTQIQQEPVPRTTGGIVDKQKVQDFMDSLKYLKPGFAQVAEIKTVIAGEITQADFEEKTIDNRSFVFFIRLKNPSGQSISYWFTQRDLENTPVRLTSREGGGEIKVTDKVY